MAKDTTRERQKDLLDSLEAAAEAPDIPAFLEAYSLTDYSYRSATDRESLPRLILQIEMGGIEATAVVDTGAPYVVCAPRLARQINLSPGPSLGQIRLLIRGVHMRGHLYRLNMTFLARMGNDLEVDATAFVPNPEWEESWGNLPSFIGLGGCLERMCFVVDPGSDTFYFGAL